MEKTRPQFRKIYFAFLTLYVLILIVIVWASEGVGRVYNEKIVSVFSTAVQNEVLVGNHRSLIASYEQSLSHYFNGIEYYSTDSAGKILKFKHPDVFSPTLKAGNGSFFQRSTLYYFSNQSYIVFYWSVALIYSYIALSWSGLLMVGLYALNKILNRLKEQHDKDIEYSQTMGIRKTARQVAHDIRSPLAALNVVMHEAQSLPENTRLMVRDAISRINDIANNLLSQNRTLKNDTQSPDSNKQEFKAQLVPAIVDSVISEKRYQYRSRQDLEITLDIAPSAYGAFSNMSHVEFKRIISNLINNAAEAMQGRSNGKIKVEIASSTDKINLEIKDNGKGIPASILNQLGKKEVTFNKASGSGLGLLHAITTLKEWDAECRIKATLQTGTTILISLVKTAAPEWFAQNILYDGGLVVVLDDDASIHQIWSGRFPREKIAHFTDPQTFIASYEDKEQTYLIDYEYLGSDLNGLDVIKQCSIRKNIHLVTSHYEDTQLQSKCMNLNIKIVPKGMAGFVPIVSPTKYDLVLVDDDPLTHLIWKKTALSKNLRLLAFKTTPEFLQKTETLDKHTPIYVDSNLSNGEKGEDLVKLLFDRGFTNLTMATGCDPEDFSQLHFLKGVVGKGFPIP